MILHYKSFNNYCLYYLEKLVFKLKFKIHKN